MKKLYACIAFLFFMVSVANSQTTYTSVLDGSWNDASKWDGNGPPPAFTFTADIINIESNITLNTSYYNIGGLSTIINIGSGSLLEVGGHVMSSGPSAAINVDAGGTLKIYGNQIPSVPAGNFIVNGILDWANDGVDMPSGITWGSNSRLKLTGITTGFPGLTSDAYNHLEIDCPILATDLSYLFYELSKFDNVYLVNTGTGSLLIEKEGENETLFDGDLDIAEDAHLIIGPEGKLHITGQLTTYDEGSLTIQSNALGETGSLISNSITTTTNFGTFQQYIDKDIWHLLSSPINTSSSIGDFTLANFNPPGNQVYAYMRVWDAATQDWGDYLEDEEYELGVRVGHEYWTTVSFEVELSGAFNTSTQEFFLGDEGDWDLIGNPYPCAIDWDSVPDTTNVQGAAIYYYNKYNGTNGYATYSKDIALYGATSRIPPFQSFFVQRKIGGGSSITFNNGHKVHPDHEFYKSAKKNTGAIDRLRLQVTQNDFWSEMVIGYSEGASNDYDIDYDVEMFRGDYKVAPDIYSLAGDEKIIINRVGSYPAIIPLEIEVIEAGIINLTVTELLYMQEYTIIELEDRETGVFYTLDESFTGITFDVQPGILSDRFFVHYSTTVGIDDIEEKISDIYSNRDRIYINMNEVDSYEVQIINMMGQTVYSQKINGSGLQSITLDQPAAYYLVNLISDGQNITEKVYIAK